VLLAHLSDSHLTTGPLAGGPAAGLHAALGRLLGLPTRPDAAVITGDLTDHGHPDEYHQLTELLAGIPLPVYLAAGNHDNRGALLDAFAGTAQLAGGDQAHYAADLPSATLVVLDGPSPSPATLGTPVPPPAIGHCDIRPTGRHGGRPGYSPAAWRSRWLGR